MRETTDAQKTEVEIGRQNVKNKIDRKTRKSKGNHRYDVKDRKKNV